MLVVGFSTVRNVVFGQTFKFIKPNARGSTSIPIDRSATQNRSNERRQELGKKLKVELYQFEHCPFCYKVRNYLGMNNIQFKKIEVNMFGKPELKFSKYKKVPLTMINDTQVVDSRVILGLLESHLITGMSIRDILVNYNIKIDDKQVSIPDPYAIYDPEPLSEDLKEFRLRESDWRKIVNDNVYKLLPYNAYYTPIEACMTSFQVIKSLNANPAQKFAAYMFGGIGMYSLFRNLKEDPREKFYKKLKVWLESVGNLEFHGGSRPSLADIEMFSALHALELYPVYPLVFKAIPTLTPWYERMKNYKFS